jgi:signal transduction histidine kinase
MAFGFKARVLLELGAELISSDAVALYELVKNSLDANATAVRIDIRVSLQPSAFNQLLEYGGSQIPLELQGAPTEFSVAVFRETVLESLESAAHPDTRAEFASLFGQPKSFTEAVQNLREAYFLTNLISVTDNGGGMSFEDLRSIYLTVGTPERLRHKKEAVAAVQGATSRLHFTKTDAKLPLGEKGIGRLAAMRLGHCIRVRTKTDTAPQWNWLDLDWRPAFSDPTLDANDPSLDFVPYKKPAQPDEEKASGTAIYIQALQSDWSSEKVKRIVFNDLAKIANPFTKARANKFISVLYQGEAVSVPRFDAEPLADADAVVRAQFRYDENNEPELALHVTYRGKERTSHMEGEHLRGCVREEPGTRNKKQPILLLDSEVVARALKNLGPWELEFHWFNRGRIQKKDRDYYDNILRPFLDQWGGGFLVYRDGYRVYPYGERSDDWLDLDRRALAGGGFKLNRAQILGQLRLSSIANPMLLDQTNREGFRDSPDKEALKRLLRYTVIGFVRPFLEQVDKLEIEPIEIVAQAVEERISTSRELAVEGLRRITASAPDEKKNVATVMHHLEEVSDAWERAKLRIEKFDEEIEDYIHLAGVGLMLEFIAHELARVTQDTLKAVTSGRLSPAAVEAQLKTLERRVRILDELSIPGRQMRYQQSILDIALMLTDFHQAKAERTDIELEVQPREEKTVWQERVEKGQILQILDNLLSNSFYWLSNRLDRSIRGRILISVDRLKREVRVTDNGPGVSEDRREIVFDRFESTKPPRAGRGLGLFIARKLAEENGATLELGPSDSDGYSRTFILSFAPKGQLLLS